MQKVVFFAVETVFLFCCFFVVVVLFGIVKMSKRADLQDWDKL